LFKNALCAAPSHVIGMLTVALPDQHTPCKGCALGKMHDHPYPPSDKHATHPLRLVHSDLIGLMPTESQPHAHYVLTFIDDYSSFAVVAFLCTKDSVSQHFQSMVSWAKTSTGHMLRTLLEKAEAIHQHACLLHSFWQNAVEIALHI